MINDLNVNLNLGGDLPLVTFINVQYPSHRLPRSTLGTSPKPNPRMTNLSRLAHGPGTSPDDRAMLPE